MISSQNRLSRVLLPGHWPVAGGRQRGRAPSRSSSGAVTAPAPAGSARALRVVGTCNRQSLARGCLLPARTGMSCSQGCEPTRSLVDLIAVIGVFPRWFSASSESPASSALPVSGEPVRRGPIAVGLSRARTVRPVNASLRRATRFRSAAGPRVPRRAEFADGQTDPKRTRR